jgi:hypothetical protein
MADRGGAARRRPSGWISEAATVGCHGAAAASGCRAVGDFLLYEGLSRLWVEY